MNADEEERVRFVRAHTSLAPAPLVPELRLFTATEVTPLWQVTEAWLGRTGVAIPFWSVPWAGGQALARWLLDHPDAVRGRAVVDLACGGGIVAVAAARAGAARVVATDKDPLAATATRLAAEENGVDAVVSARAEDAFGAGASRTLLDADVVLAGDVWYEEEPAAAFAALLAGAAARGALVLTGDPGRHYVPDRLVELEELAVHDVPTPWELESASSRRTRVLRFR